MGVRSGGNLGRRQFRLRQYPTEQIVEIVGNSAGECSQALQFLPRERLRLRPPGIGNIQAGADISDELPVAIAWHALIHDPAIVAVATPQPELYLERAARLKRTAACTEALV